MLLHSIKKYSVGSAMVLLLMSVCLTAGVADSKEGNSAISQQDFLDLFASAPRENKELLDGWNDYIIRVLGYSNAEHLEVIHELTLDYAGAVKVLDEKYENDLKQDRINYSSKWLRELVDRFGRTFVCKNKRIIMMNLMMAIGRSNAEKYDPAAKDVLSKESILNLAYQRYLGVFMQYYNNLSGKDQVEMKPWKDVAERYLANTGKSHFATAYYGMRMKDKIRNHALEKENKELYLFFKDTNLPFGSGAVDNAEKDIDMLIEICGRKNSK